MRYKDIKEQYIGKTMVFIGASDLQVNFFSGVDPPNFFEIGQELFVEDCEVHSCYTKLASNIFPPYLWYF